MSVEENIKVVQAVDEASNNRDWNAFDALHTEDVVSINPMTPEPVKGITPHREAVQGLLNAFPDAKMTRERSFGQGDWVYAEYTLTGTHKGSLPGPSGKDIPPTNKSLKLTLSVACRIKDGKLAEEHVFYDRLSLLTQLGITP